MLVPKSCDFKITPSAEPKSGTPQDSKNAELLEASAQFASNEPLAYVEILDNDDVIYSHEMTNPMPRETDQTAVFRVDWQSLEHLKNARPLRGSMTLKGAEGSWQVPPNMQLDGQRIYFSGMASSIWVDRALLSLPKNQLDAAVLEIKLPGIWQGELSLRKIYDDGIYGIPGPVGLNFVISRFLRQDHMPKHLGTEAVAFAVPVLPDLPRSRLHLQAITNSGKTYRSPSVVTGQPAGRTEKVIIYSDHAKRPVEVEVDAASVPNIVYEFTPNETGSLLKTSAGRPFWGILGGYSSQATGRGGAESRDGTPFLKESDYPAKISSSQSVSYANDPVSQSADRNVQSAPGWVELAPGSYALAFNGKSTFLTLPQGVIPRRAAFEIQTELMPEHVEGKQLLLSSRSYHSGSLTLFLDRGLLKARFMANPGRESQVNSGLKMVPGQWNDLRVRYDQKAITFQINGQTSRPFPLPGPGLYDTVTVVGGYGKEWFAGKMKSLRIRHALPEKSGDSPNPS